MLGSLVMVVYQIFSVIGNFTTNHPRKRGTKSELLQMHALLKLSDRFERCANSFFDNSLIALHSFSFTQKIKDHSSLLSVRSINKSDVPSSAN
jgi:hypothetical protein